MKLRAFSFAVILVGIGVGSSGCGRYAVRPDEKEFLADRIMLPDFDEQEVASDQHILSNREGSQGGNGAGGGGCGCN